MSNLVSGVARPRPACYSEMTTYGELTFGKVTFGEVTFAEMTFGELTFGEPTGHQIPMKYCSILHYLNIVPVVYSKITCKRGSFCSKGDGKFCTSQEPKLLDQFGKRNRHLILIVDINISNCGYQQYELSISTNCIDDIENSNC